MGVKTNEMDDNDDYLARIPTGATEATPEGPVIPIPEEVESELTRAWVRTKLGKNRGEERPISGTTASFDGLLDQLLVAKASA